MSGAFPFFKNGKLLFCSDGRLADACCADSGGEPGAGGWTTEWDDSARPVPPCDPPTDYDGSWGIYAFCPVGDCGGEPTAITVGFAGEAENPCSVGGSVPTQVECEKLRIAFTPPITGTGTWTAWTPAGVFSMPIEGVAGTTAEYEIELSSEDRAAMFENAGLHAFSSRVVIGNGSAQFAQERTLYLYVFDVTDYTESDTRFYVPFVIPSLYSAAENCRIKDNLGRRIHSMGLVVGQYDSQNRANEVLNGYDVTIEHWVKSCKCPSDCSSNPNGSSGIDSWSPYSGVLDIAGCPAGGGIECPYDLSWYMNTVGTTGVEIFLQARDTSSGAWGTVTGGGAGEYSYAAYVPTCREFRLLANIEAGAGGEANINWTGETAAGNPADCSPALESAFAEVPTY